MDLDAVRGQLDRERRTLARDREVVDILPHVTRLRGADGSYHTVTFSSLAGDTADAVIEAELAHHRGLGVAFEWKVYAHDRPADLRERLARRGFAVGPQEAVLVLDLHDPPPWVTEGSRLEVVRVERPEQVELYRRAAEVVFRKDYAFTARQLLEGIAARSRQHVGYVAVVDGGPVGIGRLYSHPDSAFGGLYGGGTVPGFRGKGVYRAVVAARARDALVCGARYLLVDALPTSRPILERLGFVRLTDTWPCEWMP